MKCLFAVVALGLLVAGCDGRNSSAIPTAPSAAPPVAANPPAPPVALPFTGYVADTAFRALADVRVEVMQGADTGKVMFSDAQGRFSYTGTFASPVALRATKDGYGGASATVRVFNSTAFASFQLAPLDPPVVIGENYTLTITADPSCASLPDAVRSRSYAATVKPSSNSTAPLNTMFNGTVSGGRFAPYANAFWIGVAGSYVAISTDGEGPSIVEEVGPNTFVAFGVNAGVTVQSSGAASISGPVRGVIEYCELKGPVGAYYDCRPELAEVRVQCTSGGTLTLTRR